jgi:farnesyl-diphosphate farnesyltransferase
MFPSLLKTFPKIERWAEHHYPSFIDVSVSASQKPSVQLNETDARARLVKRTADRKEEKEKEKTKAVLPSNGEQSEEPGWKFYAIVFSGFTLVMGLSVVLVFGLAWLMGWLEVDASVAGG